MNIDKVIPDRKVLDDVVDFLDKCGWELEIESKSVLIPKDVKLDVQTKAYVQACAPDIFLGNHYEVVVIDK